MRIGIVVRSPGVVNAPLPGKRPDARPVVLRDDEDDIGTAPAAVQTLRPASIRKGNDTHELFGRFDPAADGSRPKVSKAAMMLT
jgi:hypothetical protein